MKTKYIDSFSKLHKAIQSKWSGYPIFRGEDRDDYVLRPKYGRCMAENKLNNLANEIEILDEFKRRAVPFLSVNPHSNHEWLAVAQHHGLATRLLDWTRNPLVAAYFAVHKNYSTDSVIYVMERYALETTDESTDPFSIKDDVVYEPRHATSRITAQLGLFTLHANPDQEFAHKTLERWVIRKSCAVVIDFTIEQYGISDATVFPGLDSIAREIHSEYIRS